jgi:hypothetical protein
VVGGVGGAIVLAVIAGVIWRLRKKRQQRGGMGYEGWGEAEVPGMHDKAEVPVGGTYGAAGAQGNGTPFKTTLESYHAGQGVNASSNF